MKNFTRSDLLFSLCGLNCGLCSMHLGGHCPGCGGGEGNQSCKIARCSLQHGRPEYCSQCQEFLCEKYEDIDAFDSFITHRNRIKDLEKQQEPGLVGDFVENFCLHISIFCDMIKTLWIRAFCGNDSFGYFILFSCLYNFFTGIVAF